LGDFDGDFDPEIYKEKQYPLEIVHAPNQEKTDLEKALDYLVEKGHKAVNIVWATGKRADHTLANITSIVSYRDKIKIVIIDDHSKIFLLPKRFEKWYTANTPISLIPVGKVTGITSQNLFYSLQNDDLILGYRLGNSNHVAQDGIVTITHETGDLLLLECID
jgi:thiamine pyrophosphokinase